MCKSEKIYIGIEDIHPDGRISDGKKHRRMDGKKDGAQIIIPRKKNVFGGG